MSDDKTGFDEFKAVLTDFRGLSVWALGVSAVTPFVASLIDFDPPWPRGVVPATAIIELVALAVSFQLLSTASKRTVSRSIVTSTAGFFIAILVYMFMHSMLVFQVDTTHERFVRGLVCTETAQVVFRSSCPFLTPDEIGSATWEAERLWTPGSLAVARMALVATWGASFFFLAVLLGAFIAYQRRVKQRVKKAAGP